MRFLAVALIALVAAALPCVSALTHTFDMGKQYGKFKITHSNNYKVTACAEHKWHWCHSEAPATPLAVECSANGADIPGFCQPSSIACNDPKRKIPCYFNAYQETFCTQSLMSSLTFEGLARSLHIHGICYLEQLQNRWVYVPFPQQYSTEP
ncbi:hypothetical protein ACQY0O_006061 [Thecaphora frezii]